MCIILFGKRLKSLRKPTNLTLKEVADEINVSRSSYAGYEAKDRKPPIDKLIRLSKFYNVSIDYILGLTDVKDIQKIEYNAYEYFQKDGIH